MICKFQLILNSSKFNLKIFLVGTKNKYVQFHNIKFKMPESQLLIGLKASFKNWQKALNVNIYYILKAYMWCYPFPPSVRFVHLWKCWQFWTAPLWNNINIAKRYHLCWWALICFVYCTNILNGGAACYTCVVGPELLLRTPQLRPYVNSYVYPWHISQLAVCFSWLYYTHNTFSVLSIWQVPSPGLTKNDLGLAILLNN